MHVRWVVSAVLMLAAACTPEQPPAAADPPSTQTAIATDGIPASAWHVVLIAGDSSTPAFDNGVEGLREKLAERGVRDITVYSADPASVPAGRLSSSANVRAALSSSGGKACLAFITSHGNEEGFFLRPDQRLFAPSALDRSLSEGCGREPTVVIVSACHSGTFINDATRRSNRVILTAAASDRTSFGCSAEDEYTYYDRCLLQQFDKAGTWRDLADSTRSCVEGLERKLGVDKASQPQLFVGAGVADLHLPGR
jgi:hypothetical protein